MFKIWVIIIALCSVHLSWAQQSASFFEADFEAVDRAMAPVDSFEQALISADFELPGDSLNQGKKTFPIMGIPTFWLVFAPTCAGCCAFPCGSPMIGLISVGYISYFGNEYEKKQAITGCLVGQIPTVIFAVAYGFALSGI